MHSVQASSLAYFILLATGHSADLGEEAELGMAEENEDKVAWVVEIMYGWIGQQPGSGLSDRPRLALGQIHF
jgi:hypothetical protein